MALFKAPTYYPAVPKSQQNMGGSINRWGEGDAVELGVKTSGCTKFFPPLEIEARLIILLISKISPHQ